MWRTSTFTEPDLPVLACFQAALVEIHAKTERSQRSVQVDHGLAVGCHTVRQKNIEVGFFAVQPACGDWETVITA